MPSAPTMTHYIDAVAYEAYASHDGQELVVSKLVPGSPSQAFDAWIQHAWVVPVSTKSDDRGRGRGHVGHQRYILGGMVMEEIVSAGEPSHEASSPGGGIPSVCYKLRKFGPLPYKDHIGFVSFLPDASAPRDRPATLIVWAVKATPSALGGLTCFGGSLFRLVQSALRSMLDQALNDVRDALQPVAAAARD